MTVYDLPSRMEDDMLSSQPFEFVVQGQLFYIHKRLVVQASKPFERLINGGMLEARQGQVVLETEDKATFARFCDWIYTGNYCAEPHSERPKVKVREEEKSQEADKVADQATASFGSSHCVSRKKGQKSAYTSQNAEDPQSKKTALKEAFLRAQYLKSEDERSPWVPRANTGPSEDYSNTFLSHARLYVFAEKFDVQSLKRLVLKNIHQTLAAFTLWPDCVGDVISLFEHVYSNTLATRGRGDPMRGILNHYISYEIEGVIEAAAFRDLLEKNRDLLDDFCFDVGRRV